MGRHHLEYNGEVIQILEKYLSTAGLATCRSFESILSSQIQQSQLYPEHVLKLLPTLKRKVPSISANEWQRVQGFGEKRNTSKRVFCGSSQAAG